MANPFVKAWKYFMALFDSKIDEHADPKVQIQQAIEEAQRQHQELSQQAAAVIGNQRQLEMQLNRRLADIEKLQANTRQAIQLADKARASGDIQKATEYENAAEAFAAQLVTAEQSVEDTKKLHDQALQQASAAKKAVERNSMALQQKVAERTKLLSQLEQAKMQEKVAESIQSMNSIRSGYAKFGSGAGKDRAALCQRFGLGRAGGEYGAGPHGGNRAGWGADGWAFSSRARARLQVRSSLLRRLSPRLRLPMMQLPGGCGSCVVIYRLL